MAVNEPNYIPDITPYMEYYRQADGLLRRYFLKAISLAAAGEMEGKALSNYMTNFIKNNSLGIETPIDPTKIGAFAFPLRLP